MSAEHNGGSAFPRAKGVIVDGFPGMTLRDYFAAKAMASFVSLANAGTNFGVSHADTNLRYAKASYAMADAMLEERQS